MMKYVSGKDWARAYADSIFQASVEGKFHRPSIYDQKRARPFGKFYYVHHEMEHNANTGKKPAPVIYVTYYDMGKVYDRRGKR